MKSGMDAAVRRAIIETSQGGVLILFEVTYTSPHAGRLPPSRRALPLLLQRGDPREPMHIHADGADGSAKFWLYPEVSVARSTGFSRRQLAEMTAVVIERRAEIERAWDEFFG